MTLPDSAPYSGSIRTLLPIGFLALSACVTDGVTRTEVNELTASLRAMRAENARLEGRLDAIEKQLAVRGRPAAPAAASAVAESNEMPALTVVKLKPRREAAPRIATEVPVVEPSDADVVTVTDATLANQPSSDEVAFADGQYDKALAGLKTGNTEGSVTALKQFAADNPRHPKADNALYFAGVGEMGLRDFETALKTFEGLVARYPASDTALDAQLKLAECKARLNRADEAKAAYQHIVATSPGTTAASVAQSRLANWSSAPAATR